MSKLGKFSENHENHENVQQHEMDFVVFHEFYETFDFLIQVLPSPQGGGGAYPCMVLRLNTLPQPSYREMGIFMTSTFENINGFYLQFPQPPMPSELLEILVISGFKVA